MLVSGALDPLTSGARSSLGRALTEPELEAFDKYLKLLQQWQRSQRLIGSTEPRWIVENLFLDSLLFLHLVPDDVRSVADLGSGAGVPSGCGASTTLAYRPSPGGLTQTLPRLPRPAVWPSATCTSP